MPFENAFVTVKFSGADMQKFFDFIAAGGGDPISGARFTIANKKAIDITINGETFDSNKEYVVLTSDYMANGGDGGAIFTNDDDLAHKLRGIVNHGMYERYHHDVVGVNSRLDSIQAAVLNAKLPFLNDADGFNIS